MLTLLVYDDGFEIRHCQTSFYVDRRLVRFSDLPHWNGCRKKRSKRQESGSTCRKIWRFVVSGIVISLLFLRARAIRRLCLLLRQVALRVKCQTIPSWSSTSAVRGIKTWKHHLLQVLVLPRLSKFLIVTVCLVYCLAFVRDVGITPLSKWIARLFGFWSRRRGRAHECMVFGAR